MFDELLDEREMLMKASRGGGAGGESATATAVDRGWWWKVLRYVIPGPCHNYVKPASVSQEQRPRLYCAKAWYCDTHLREAKEELWPMVSGVTRRSPQSPLDAETKAEEEVWYLQMDKKEKDNGNGVMLVRLKARTHRACGIAAGGGGGCGLWEEDTISDEIWKGGARYSLVVVASPGYGSGGIFDHHDDDDDDDDGDEDEEEEEEEDDDDEDEEVDEEVDEEDEDGGDEEELDYDKDGQRHARFDYMCEHHGVVGDCTGHMWRWTEDEMYDEEYDTDIAGKGKIPASVYHRFP